MNRRTYYFLSIVFFVGLLALDLAVLLQPGRFRELIDAEINKNLKAHYSYEDIGFSGRAVTVKGLVLARPEDAEAIAFTCDRVDVGIDWMALFDGELKVRKISIDHPVVHLWWNDEGELDLPNLLASSDTKSRAPSIPALEIRGLELKFENAPFLDPESDIALEHIDLEFTPRFSDVYNYAFRGKLRDDTFGSLDMHGAFGTALFRARAECQGFRVTPKLAAVFRKDLREVLEPIQMEGGLDLKLDVDSRERLGGFDIRLEAETEGLSLGWGPGRHIVENLTGAFAFSGRRFESQHLRFDIRGAPVSVKELRLDLPDQENSEPVFNMRAVADDLMVDREFAESLLDLPEPFPTVGDSILAFGCEGPIAIDCTLEDDPKKRSDPEDERVRVDCLVRFLDTTLAWCGYEDEQGVREGYPYPITRLHGTMRLWNDGVHTDGLRSIAPDQDAVIKGNVTFGREPLTYDITVDAKDLELDERIRGALSTDELAIYDRFEPKGQIDLFLKVKNTPDPADDTAEVALDFGLHLEEARAREMPILMRNVEGKVRIETGKPVLLKDVTADLGRKDAGRVLLNGDIDFREVEGETEETFALNIGGKNLLIGDELLDALDVGFPEISGDLRTHQVAGRMDMNAQLFQGRPETNDITFDCKGVRLRLPEFPDTQLSDLVARFRLLDDRLTIESGSFRALNNRFEPTGWIEFGDERRWDVEMRGRDLDIDNRMVEFGSGLSEDFRELKTDFDFFGKMDLTVTLRKSSVGELVTTTLEPRGMTIQHRRRPFVLRKLHGKLRIREDRMRADDFSGELLGGRGPSPVVVPLQLKRANFADDSGWNLQSIGISKLPFGESMATWAPPAIAKIVRDYKLVGTADAQIDTLRAKDGRIVVEGKVYPKNASADLGVPVRVESAIIDVGVAVIDDKGLQSLEARIGRASGKLRNFDFEKLSAKIAFEEETLDVSQVDASLVGGRTRPKETSFRIGLVDGNPFNASMTLLECDLSKLVRTFGGEAKTLSGNANLTAGLSGRIDDFASYRGEGRVKMRGDRLYDLPFFAAVFQIINFDFLTTPSRGSQTGEMKLRVANQTIDVERALFRGPGINLDGDGKIGFDGICQLQFKPKAIKLLDSIPLVGEISDLVGGIIVDKVYVTGPIESPRASVGNYLTDILPSEPDSGRRPVVRPPRPDDKKKPSRPAKKN